MKTYVLYHANCYDGFGAAWAAWKRLGDDATYIPVSYGNPPPEIEPHSTVYLLDFSYPREILLSLAERVYHLTVLDHHKTAQQELAELGRPVHRFNIEVNPPGLFVNFDMDESGASLAWKYFCKSEPSIRQEASDLIEYIKDRDLWRFSLTYSKEISAWLHSYPFDFQTWDLLSYDLAYDSFPRFCHEGAAILRSQSQQIESMCRHLQWIELGGVRVPCVNATTLFSECGDFLCEQYPDASFAAYYCDRNDGKRQWGLRSRNGFDVSEIAKLYGGGGHEVAAGFTTLCPPLMDISKE